MCGRGSYPHELKIFIMESVNGFYLRIELHDRRRRGELFPSLGPDGSGTGADPPERRMNPRHTACLGGHKQQQRIGSNVEAGTPKDPRCVLVKLEGCRAFLLPAGRESQKLEQEWHGGRAMSSTRATFHAPTMCLRPWIVPGRQPVWQSGQWACRRFLGQQRHARAVHTAPDLRFSSAHHPRC